MKDEILRIYFRVTNLEVTRSGYRQKLHQAFTSIFPNFPATEQNLADQLRFILNNINTQRKEQIKREVVQELQQQ